MAPRVTLEPSSEAPSQSHSSGTGSRRQSLARGVRRTGDDILFKVAAHPRLVQLGIWIVVFGSMALGVWMWANGRLHIEDVGYPATFYLNLIGSASIVVPVPGLFAVCVAATESLGLHLALLGVIGGAGAAIGETTAYLAGYAGHRVVENVRWYSRINGLMERRGGITIFLLALIPNPFIDVAGIAAGALRYPYRKFILYIFVGKTIRLIILAYACRESIEWLMDIFQSRLAGLG